MRRWATWNPVRRLAERRAIRAAAEARIVVENWGPGSYYDFRQPDTAVWVANCVPSAGARLDWQLHRYVYLHPLCVGGVGIDVFLGGYFGWLDCGGLPHVYEGPSLDAAMYHVEQGYRYLKGGDRHHEPSPYVYVGWRRGAPREAA